MPKAKTHSGAAKRFKKTGGGFKRRRAFRNHILTKKTTKQKWEDKMKEKEPLQCWIVNIMSSTKPFY